jgi:hypothetical protein
MKKSVRTKGREEFQVLSLLILYRTWAFASIIAAVDALSSADTLRDLLSSSLLAYLVLPYMFFLELVTPSFSLRFNLKPKKLC